MRFFVVVSQQLSAGDANLVECGWERVVCNSNGDFSKEILEKTFTTSE